MRFISPLFMLAVGGYVWWFNESHSDQYLLFPFVDKIVPSTAGDPDAQGRISAYIFLSIGGLMLFRAIYFHLRNVGRRTD